MQYMPADCHQHKKVKKHKQLRTDTSLTFVLPMDKRMLFRGRVNPVLIIAFKYASK